MVNLWFTIEREFSETGAIALTGLSSLAIVTRVWAKCRNRFFMAGEVGENRHSAQGEEKPDIQLELLIRRAQVTMLIPKKIYTH